MFPLPMRPPVVPLFVLPALDERVVAVDDELPALADMLPDADALCWPGLEACSRFNCWVSARSCSADSRAEYLWRTFALAVPAKAIQSAAPSARGFMVMRCTPMFAPHATRTAGEKNR